MESIQGKHFSITDPEGFNTVIYRVNKTAKEYLNEYPKYTVERLLSAEELNGNLKRKTFFIDEPDYEEQLIILTFGKEKVVVNMGILEDDRIKISKKPMPIKFNTLYSDKEGEYRLSKAGVMNADVDAEALYCFLKKCDKVVLFLMKEEEADKETEKA